MSCENQYSRKEYLFEQYDNKAKNQCPAGVLRKETKSQRILRILGTGQRADDLKESPG